MSRWAKIILVLVLLLSGLVLLARAFQAELGMVLIENLVGARVGLDATRDLPDGLHVVLCGTGSPLPDPERAGPCTLVIAGQHMFLVDAGEGAARNLALMGIPHARLDGVLLTHMHSDHIDGMGPVLLMRWTTGAATSPLPVHGPAGVDKVVAGFNTAYALDAGYRTAHHGPAIAPPSGAGAVAMPFALPEAGQGNTTAVLEQDGVRITAIRVDHGVVEPGVGYRIDYGGRAVVISGDTARSTSLAEGARGCDLLVHEALQPRIVKRLTEGFVAKGNTGVAQITRDILSYHSSPEDAADVATAAGARHLVLSHIIPPMMRPILYPAFLGEAPKRFSGPITVGEDGMIFSLPTGGTEIRQRRLM